MKEEIRESKEEWRVRVEAFHLQGQHDQQTHGHDQGGSEGTTFPKTGMDMYLTGGLVRDRVLGEAGHDHDFLVVVPKDTKDPLSYVKKNLTERGVEIDPWVPKYETLRGRFIKGTFPADDPEFPGIEAEFIVGGKVGSNGLVRPGHLRDDLSRRDFTVNAMGLKDGKIIDPFGGQEDARTRTLRFVGNADQRIQEDPLRTMRALRFTVTKDFKLAPETSRAINSPVVPRLLSRIEPRRRADELSLMLSHDREKTIRTLNSLPKDLRESIFSGGVRELMEARNQSVY